MQAQANYKIMSSLSPSLLLDKFAKMWIWRIWLKMMYNVYLSHSLLVKKREKDFSRKSGRQVFVFSSRFYVVKAVSSWKALGTGRRAHCNVQYALTACTCVKREGEQKWGVGVEKADACCKRSRGGQLVYASQFPHEFFKICK